MADQFPNIGLRKEENQVTSQPSGQVAEGLATPTKETKRAIPDARVPLPLAKPVVMSPQKVELRNMIQASETVGGNADVFDAKVYNDTEGNPSIGWGYNLNRKDARAKITALGLDYDKVRSGEQQINKAQANQLLDYTLGEATDGARRLFNNFDSMTTGRQATIVDLIYNQNEKKIAGFPRMVEALRTGDYSTAAKELMTNSSGTGPSDYSKQVPNRAERNRAALLSGQRPDIRESMPPRAQFGAISQVSADDNAKAQRLATRLGLPLDVVQRNLAKVEAKKAADDFHLATIDSPVVKDFLSDPTNLAVAHDDVENLSAFSRISNAFQRGELLHASGRLGTQLRDGRGVDTQSQLDSVRERLNNLGEDGEGFISWITSAAEVVGQQVASFGSPEAAVRIGGGATIGATLGAAGGPLAPATAVAGGAIGMAAGAVSHIVLDTFEVEGGLAFVEMLDQGIDVPTARALSIGVGAINAALELGGDVVLAAPFVMAGKKLLKAGVKEAMTSPRVLKAFGVLATTYGAGVTAEVGVEVLQEGVNIAAEEIGKALTDPNLEQATAEEIQERLVTIAVKTAKAMALLAAPGPTGNFAVDYHRARSHKKRTDELNKTAEASKLAKRDKAKAQQFQTAVLDRAGVSEVSVAAPTLLEWAQAAEVGPREALRSLGVDEASLTNAMENGGDIVFSAQAFVENILGTPGYATVANDLRMVRGVETVNESVIPLLAQAPELQAALEADTTIKPGLKARTKALLDTFLSGDPKAVVEEMRKIAPDVGDTLTRLLDKAAQDKTGVDEVVIQGRLKKLDHEIAAMDQQIVETADALALAETEGRGTKRLSDKLDALQVQMVAAQDEQANIEFPRRPVDQRAAASENIRQPVPEDVLAANRFINQQLEDLRAQKLATEDEVARAKEAGDKTRFNRVMRHRTSLNKSIAVAEEALANNIADHTPPVAPRNQPIDLKARTLDALKVRVTGDKISAVRDAFRKGYAEARANIGAVQDIATSLIQRSGLSKEGQAKFLTAIKNLQPTQIERQLVILQSRVLQQLQAERSQQIRKALKKLVKGTKPAMVSGKPVGKYDHMVQEVLDRAREISRMSRPAAAIHLENLLNDVNPTPASYLEGRLLAIMADNGAVTPAEAEATLLDLQAIKEDGAAMGKLRIGRRVNKANKAAEEGLAALENGKPTEMLTSHGWAARVGERLRTIKSFLGATWHGWDDVLDIMFKTNKNNDITQLRESLRLSAALQRVKGHIETWRKGTIKIGLESFDVTTERQLLNRLHDDSQPATQGRHTNLNGVSVELNYTKSEARKLWMEMQDPTVASAITDPSGNAYTQEMLDAIFFDMDAHDFAYAKAQLDFYRSMYPAINEVYRSLYGVNMPFNEMYSPILRDVGSRTDTQQGNTEDNGGLIPNELKFRRQVAGQVRSRTLGAIPLLQRPDVGAMQRYIHDMAHFVETAERVAHIRAVFSDPRLRRAIERKHSPKAMQEVDAMVANFGTGYAPRGGLFEDVINAFNRRFAVAQLAIKPIIGAKQLTSWFAMSDNMPFTAFLKHNSEFISNPIKAKEFVTLLWNSSAAIRSRGDSLDFELAKIGSIKKPALFGKRSTSIEHGLMVFIRLGDRAPIYAGGYAIYKEAIKAGKSHEQAVIEIEDAMNTTQQSNDIDKLSTLQSGHALGRTMTMFMTARYSLLRGEMRAIRERPSWLFNGTGHLSAFDFGKRMGYYHFAMPMLIQYMASGFKWDDDRMATAAILGQLNSLVIIGDLMTEGAMWALTGHLKLRGGMSMPIVDTITEIERGMAHAISSANQDKFFEAIGEILGAAGNFVAIPWASAQRIVEGALEVVDGNVEVGLKMMGGVTEKTAKESSR